MHIAIHDGFTPASVKEEGVNDEGESRVMD
jgi:hypothetical protein